VRCFVGVPGTGDPELVMVSCNLPRRVKRLNPADSDGERSVGVGSRLLLGGQILLLALSCTLAVWCSAIRTLHMVRGGVWLHVYGPE
jgi:hypothetical protein